jgi:hypothetical protein
MPGKITPVLVATAAAVFAALAPIELPGRASCAPE